MIGPGAKDRTKPVIQVPGLVMSGEALAGRYRMERLLRAGRSGFLLDARHATTQQAVTLKVLTSVDTREPDASRRAASLKGKHVAHVVDTGLLEDGTPFVATERLEGRTLAEELTERKALPPPLAVVWILQLCAGLAEAHAAGIVHGDLQPQNVFLARTNPDEEPVVKILDFGLAPALTDETAEANGPWFDLPAYLAPEQIGGAGAVDARTDVWAVGVLLHEMIAGAPPFIAETVAGMLVAVAHDEPALLTTEGTPFALAKIVKACLSKDPARRPADIVTLARQLAPFAGERGRALATAVEIASVAPPEEVEVDAPREALERTTTTQRRPLSPMRRRRRVAVGAGIGAAIAALLVGAIELVSAGPAQPSATALSTASKEEVTLPTAPKNEVPSAAGATVEPVEPSVPSVPSSSTRAAPSPAPQGAEPPMRFGMPRSPWRAPTSNAPRARTPLVRDDPYVRSAAPPRGPQRPK